MFFKWDGEPTHARILARLHRPDDCLPGLGYKFAGDKGAITLNANDLVIPFHALEFVDRGEPAYVFYCVWQDRPKLAGKHAEAWNSRLAKLEQSDRSNLLARIEPSAPEAAKTASSEARINLFIVFIYSRATCDPVFVVLRTNLKGKGVREL